MSRRLRIRLILALVAIVGAGGILLAYRSHREVRVATTITDWWRSPEPAFQLPEVTVADGSRFRAFETRSVTLDFHPDGRITYPMLGALDVLGKTTAELEATIRDALARKYIRDPQVIVFVHEMQSGNVSVLGAVREPGGISVVGSATLIDALSRAGGMSPEAGTKAFMVRKGSDEPIVIDLRRLMEEGDLTLNFPVESGDVIYVPKSRKFNVYVYGQVQSPGVFEVRDDEDISVLQAVAMAGGLARRASSGKVKIVRSGNGRGQQMIHVNLGNIIAGKALDVPLKEGDIVVVPKSFF